MLTAPKIPSTPSIWVLAFLVALLILANNLLFFNASGLLEISLTNALLKLRLVWIFIFGILFLHNPFSWNKLVGTILVVLAGWVILHSFKGPKSTKGMSFILSATLFNASVIILSKYLLTYFNAVSLTFFVSYLPVAVCIFILMPHALSRIKQVLRDDWRVVFLACGFGAFANLAINTALAGHDAASVIVINEAFLVLVLVGEHVYLKEREQAWVKLLSVVLAIGGAILIEVSH